MCKKLISLWSLGLALLALTSSSAFAVNYDLRIAAGTDDAEEHLNAGMDVGSSDLEIVYEDNGTPATDEQLIGMRWTVPIASGYVVEKAYIEVELEESKGSTAPVNVIIEGQLDPNAPAFTSEAKNISNRARTKAQVTWTIPTGMALGTKFQTPDLSPILNELISQNGWTSGNALVIIVRDNKSAPSTGIRSVHAYNGSTTGCPLLHIEAVQSATFYKLVYVDGHMHTTHSDGSGSIADLKQVALARGLSAVIVTNHTKQIVDVNEWNEIVVQTDALSEPNFLMIPSFEVTGSEGYILRDHVLAWGVYDPFVGEDANALAPEEFWPSPRNPDGTGPLYPENLRAWADYIHEHGGLAVHAHTWGTTQPGYDVDFIEVHNVGTVKNIMDEVKTATGGAVSDEMAYQLGLVMNNFAVSGSQDLNMPVDLPGFGQTTLKLALFTATGQWLGAPQSAPMHSWDEQLLAYVNDQAAKPVFGVANSDAHNTANTDMNSADPTYDASDVGEAKNGVLVTNLSTESLFGALKAGRFFATTGPSLTFEVNGTLMGQTVQIGAGQTAQIHLTGNAESQTAIVVKVEIIKNGQVLKTLTPQTPTFDVTIDDANPVNGYYRAELTTMDLVSKTYQFAWANPVFVKTTAGETQSAAAAK